MAYALAELDDSDGLLPPERRDRERPDLDRPPSLADDLSDPWLVFDDSDLGLAGRRRREEPAPRERRLSPEDAWGLSLLLRFWPPPDALRRS